MLPFLFVYLLYIHTLIYVKCNWFQVCCVILFIDLFLCVQRWHSHYHFIFKWFLLFSFSFFSRPFRTSNIYGFIISPSLKKLESLICYNSYVCVCVFILSALKIVVFIFISFFLFLLVCHVARVWHVAWFHFIKIKYRILSFGKVSPFVYSLSIYACDEFSFHLK